MKEEEEQIFELLKSQKRAVSADWLQGKLSSLSLEIIVGAINNLANAGKALMLQGANGKLLFRANADPSGAEVSGMSGDERIIYGLIQQSSSQGVWIKDLKYKSNLHQNVIAKIVKTLEARKLVKAVKSVKHATRKVYMLYDVQPSRDVTGGPWFTDSELDSDFIESLTNLIYRYILSRSFPSSSSSVSNSSAVMTAVDPLYSLDYVGYPNVLNVLKFIKEAKITSTELLLEDINCLLDVLIYDGKIERVVNVGAGNAIMYKATKPKKELNDVISSVPCGNCPVFDICSHRGTTKGPISPLNCEYYAALLDF